MLWNWLGLDDSDQRELERKLAASRATQASNLADLTEYIKSTADQNKNLWSDYQSGLGDYESQLAAALQGQKGAYAQLADALGNYKSVEDVLGAAPQLATHDPQSRLREQMNLSRIGALTGTKETAEEQLMRLVARRNMENQLKAERDATAQSLKERGVYGGGAELASALAAQQEQASRRSLEDVAANANAQKRALSALGQYQQGAASMSAADDALSKFNSSLLQQNRGLQANARVQDNSAQLQRATAKNNAATNTNMLAAQNADKVRSDQRATTAGVADANNNTANQMVGLAQMQNQAEATKQAQDIAETKHGFLEGIFD